MLGTASRRLRSTRIATIVSWLVCQRHKDCNLILFYFVHFFFWHIGLCIHANRQGLLVPSLNILVIRTPPRKPLFRLRTAAMPGRGALNTMLTKAQKLLARECRQGLSASLRTSINYLLHPLSSVKTMKTARYKQGRASVVTWIAILDS